MDVRVGTAVGRGVGVDVSVGNGVGVLVAVRVTVGESVAVGVGTIKTVSSSVKGRIWVKFTSARFCSQRPGKGTCKAGDNA